MKGDLDNSGSLTNQDLAMLRDYVAGWIDAKWLSENCPRGTMTEEEAFWRADMNSDGQVNALDVTALELQLLGAGMRELNRQTVTLTSSEAPPPSPIEQMMPLIGTVITVVMLGVMMGMLGEEGGLVS